MRPPPVELRPKVPGTFDIYVNGVWIGTITYLWQSWHYLHLGRSLDLHSFASPNEAVSALIAYHSKRATRGEDREDQVPGAQPAMKPEREPSPEGIRPLES